MSKTTVIIPNYNGISYLKDCLTFLNRSQKEPFETIVVDNGSDDGSLALLKTQFPNVKVIALPENYGFSRAVNEGIRAADTPYVLLLNNDTIVEHNFVQNLEQAMDARPTYFGISAKMLSMKQPEMIDDAGDFYCALGWAYARGKGKKAASYSYFGDVFAPCAGAAIYRRDVFDKIGYFDEAHFAYLEDIDVAYRAKLYGYRNGYCPDAIVYHAGSASSGSRYNAFKVSLSSRNSVYLIGKNMPFLQIVLNLPFLVLGYLIKILFFIKKGYGGTYLAGLWKGVSLCFSRAGRKKHVPFSLRRLPRYVRIQLELWYNVLRRFMG